MPKPLVNQVIKDKIFLIDALGALLTAIMVGFVLSANAEVFGIPRNVLRCLGLLAFILATYSISMFLWNPDEKRQWLKIIACANTLYCLLTLTLLIYYNASASMYAYFYFIGEITIILVLVYTEWNIASENI